MSWASLLHNPVGITSIYQGNPPDLIDVHLHEVVLHEDGPTLKLRLDLPRYPDQPPRKWAAQGFNTLQVEISFSGVREVTLEGFGTAISAEISLTGEEGISLNVMSAATRIWATADTAFISKLTAYANEP
ncbi:Imm50 family immunity protein [Streptomyces sp. NPDC052109]|uniref:Imm50 family immunity protein n=1 Tax=Streptomyces sp. NPDC052109 TaxID=3155527 RepID=UPI003440A36C